MSRLPHSTSASSQSIIPSYDVYLQSFCFFKPRLAPPLPRRSDLQRNFRRRSDRSSTQTAVLVDHHVGIGSDLCSDLVRIRYLQICQLKKLRRSTAISAGPWLPEFRTKLIEMTSIDVVDLSSDDDELEVLDVKPIKLEPKFVGVAQPKKNSGTRLANHQTSITLPTRHVYGEDRTFNTSRDACGNTSMLIRGNSLLNESSLPSTLTSPPPICRQFWKAGTYNNDIIGSKVNQQNGKNYLQVHPMFLHSNATSHKWAFGAIAELLDNAIDEIQNGATYIAVDKITNPRDGSSALLFQDDGGGMSPKAMQRCMGFGFTEKSGKSAIGRYGNGFKTSTMRLGADVIVFSRHLDKRVLTQSIGLLSYTFLSKTGHDTVVVPMVHYEFNTTTKKMDFLNEKERYVSNLSLMLEWSPYSTEPELMKQFGDIGSHGTKVIIYNLWYSDDGVEELDYDSDLRDIRIYGETKKADTRPAWKEVNEQHIGYRFRYSLREYLSILYLRMPDKFKIVLRREVVKHHNIADDLKYPEFIKYKPQVGSGMEVQVFTTIGFLKEAPQVNLHGFNVYHKNRLILPFWQVVNYLDSRGRGVIGILEANFVEPTHNKQDFEKTSLFQKLEGRLKEMTWEYWDLHCGLLGYQVKKKPKPDTSKPKPDNSFDHIFSPVGFTNARKRSVRPLSKPFSKYQQGLHMKSTENGDSEDIERMAKRHAVSVLNAVTNPLMRSTTEPVTGTYNQLIDQEAVTLKLENQKLREKYLEYVKEEGELTLKVSKLNIEIKQIEIEHSRLLKELEALEPQPPKKENRAT